MFVQPTTVQPLISPCIAYDIFAKLWTYVPRNTDETCPHCKGTVCNLSAHFVVECSYYKAQRDSFIRNSYKLLWYENACYIFSKSTENVYIVPYWDLHVILFKVMFIGDFLRSHLYLYTM